LIENFDRFNFAIHKEKEMADFRRWFLALAALVLVLGSAVPAVAQSGPQITCNAGTAVPVTLRHEGLTELVGDVLLTCTNGTSSTGPTPPGQTIPQANLFISLSATLGTPSIGLGLDSLLLVDDPSPANQTVCTTPTNGALCTVEGDGGQTFNQKGRYNVFQGIPGGPGGSTNSITFLGVPVDPPATGTRTYRITNVRIQAAGVPSSLSGLTAVYAFVGSSSSTSITIAETAPLIVGFVSNGLVFTPGTTPSQFLQCQTYGITGVGAVTFTENFQTAFKIQGAPGTQTTPGLVYNTESGLQVTLATGTTGQASQGTEFQTLIGNIPSGVQVYVDAASTDSVGGFASLVSPSIATSGQVLVIDNETGAPVNQLVVWQVTAADAGATDSFTFNIYVSFTGAPGSPTGSPQNNVTATALSGFSPQEAAWTGSGPIPEFLNSAQYNYPIAPAVQDLFVVNLCQTILLFPYVTDYTGFDTGIAISNTTLDGGLGATAQTGACTVAFWGINDATAGGLSTNIGTALPGNTPGFVYSTDTYGPLTPPNGDGLIQPGQTWYFSLSETDANYDAVAGGGSIGYAIATCNFQFAHGYSFVSDTGVQKFAAAYLALVIPDATRAPQAFLCASGVGCSSNQPGEQLVH
jgi:hypothetical protein